jgi:hypothetical protein
MEALERTWEPPQEVRPTDDFDADPASNPFAIPLPPKDKVVVLHPAVVQHMRAMISGRRKSLKIGLSLDQIALLKEDFLEGLDFWEPSWCCEEMAMWQALEASRYAEANSIFGRANVDLAVKLLVPTELANDPEALKRACWGVKPLEHLEGNEVCKTRFRIVPCPPVSTPPQSPAPVGTAEAAMMSPKPPKTARFEAPVVAPKAPLTARLEAPVVAPKAPTKPLQHPQSDAPEARPRASEVVQIDDDDLGLEGLGRRAQPERSQRRSAPLAAAPERLPLAPDRPAANSSKANLPPIQTAKEKEASASTSSGSSGEDEEEEEWSIEKINQVKAIILRRHEASRNYHSSAGPDDRGSDHYDEHKYYVLVRHLETKYDGKPGSHKDLFPSTPEQVDQLISLVVHECKVCSNLRKERIKEQLATETERLRRREDWNLRYQHRLQEEEYDTDDDHVADSKCGKCNLPGGRKHKIGKVHGDSDDRDQLL